MDINKLLLALLFLNDKGLLWKVSLIGAWGGIGCLPEDSMIKNCINPKYVSVKDAVDID